MLCGHTCNDSFTLIISYEMPRSHTCHNTCMSRVTYVMRWRMLCGHTCYHSFTLIISYEMPRAEWFAINVAYASGRIVRLDSFIIRLDGWIIHHSMILAYASRMMDDSWWMILNELRLHKWIKTNQPRIIQRVSHIWMSHVTHMNDSP